MKKILQTMGVILLIISIIALFLFLPRKTLVPTALYKDKKIELLKKIDLKKLKFAVELDQISLGTDIDINMEDVNMLISQTIIEKDIKIDAVNNTIKDNLLQSSMQYKLNDWISVQLHASLSPEIQDNTIILHAKDVHLGMIPVSSALFKYFFPDNLFNKDTNSFVVELPEKFKKIQINDISFQEDNQNILLNVNAELNSSDLKDLGLNLGNLLP